jgi:hypothetical protein
MKRGKPPPTEYQAGGPETESMFLRSTSLSNQIGVPMIAHCRNLTGKKSPGFTAPLAHCENRNEVKSFFNFYCPPQISFSRIAQFTWRRPRITEPVVKGREARGVVN